MLIHNIAQGVSHIFCFHFKNRLASVMFPKDTNDTKELTRAIFAEFLGTLLLVFFGCGSALATGEFLTQDGIANTNVVARLMPIAMAFGMSVAVLVYSAGKLSGGHLNPAVTFFLLLIKEISPQRSAMYVGAQFLGSTIGALILWLATSTMSYNSPESGSPPFLLGANTLNPVINSGNGFVFEVMGTFLLTMVVSLTVVIGGGPSDGQPNLGPLLIGFAVFVAHIVLIPFTGCGINPARTFGPALINSIGGQNVWESWSWIYYIGPLCGSLMSAGCFYLLQDEVVPEPVRRVSKVINNNDGVESGNAVSEEGIVMETVTTVNDVAAVPHKYHMPEGTTSTGFHSTVH